MATVEEQVATIHHHQKEYAKKKDVDKLIEVYTDDAKLMPPFETVKEGKEAISQWWTKVLKESGMPDNDAEPQEETKEIINTGTHMIEWGFWSVVKDGNVVKEGNVVMHGKYLRVLKSVNGELKISHDIWNTEPVPEKQ